MPSKAIEIDDVLLDTISGRARALGLSARAYIEGVLEREAAKPLGQAEDEETMRKFERLGYIDAGLDI